MADKALAIIGGGASATLLLAQLARRGFAGEIDVYDRAGAFARGVAYSTLHACHLLNVRAANMSALADEPDDFVRWAARHGYAAGQYLAEHLDAARQALHVSLLTQEASSVQTTDGFVVNGKHYNLVIQATGNCVPQRPLLEGRICGYYEHPWQPEIPVACAHGRVVLLGSGLSAIDMLMALDAHGHNGSIVALSRHAHFPAVHISTAAHPAFIRELPPTARAALRRIRAEIECARMPWQAVVDALRPFTNAIWEAWSLPERQRFMRHLFSVWNHHRHRMPEQVAQTVTRLEQSGHLTRRRGTIRRILPGPVVVTDAGNLHADIVINCLGYRYDGYLMPASHRIGPPCFGALLETTAIPEIRMQAAGLAAQLCAASTTPLP